MVRILSRVKEIIKYSVLYGCLTHCTFEYVGDFVVCNGPSMEPTLQTKNILVTERISTRFHKLDRGDIIVAVSPTDPKQFICKRIVGMPGDCVWSKKPNVTDIVELLNKQRDNGNNQAEYSDKSSEECIQRGFVWIEGDNSANSSDSRYYGAIPLGLIKSRVVCRLWPLSEMRIF